MEKLKGFESSEVSKKAYMLRKTLSCLIHHQGYVQIGLNVTQERKMKNDILQAYTIKKIYIEGKSLLIFCVVC